MPESISLISNTDIKQKEFVFFLQQVGATLHPDNQYDGQISQGSFHVWIALDNSELTNFDAQEIQLMTQQVGDKPKTHILLDISKKTGSKEIALDFACKFAKHWNCILYNLNEQICSREELLKICQNKPNFISP